MYLLVFMHILMKCTVQEEKKLLSFQRSQYLNHLPLSPYSRFPGELASILLLAFSLLALVAALSHCLCSESPYLSTELYHIYVCYTNITLYIAFGIIRVFT
jgi:hypothetical protein